MSSIRADEMTAMIKQRLAAYGREPVVDEVGSILQVGDGIARISGLGDCMAGEMLIFADDTIGLALNLEEDCVGAVVLGPCEDLAEGQTVRRSGRVLEVPVGEALLGRVVDPLGRPIDGKGVIHTETTHPVEAPAPGLADRRSVREPLQTGLKAVDSLTPVGRGQRELVIGDRKTGKTTICIDTIINQADSGVICVYVAIGQKESTIAAIVKHLQSAGAMPYTIVVAAPASAPAPLQFLAPYAGCAMAEFFMYTTWAHDEDGQPLIRDGVHVPRPLAEGGRGLATFIAYDDLSKQAAAYREMSLLLRRPPGREAYPGDVFYLHSRLLERAARLHPRLGGGSQTAFPVIETQQGEVSAYIPTNVISITDGQIYLQPDLFNQGQRPAIDVGLSVSRVGGNAQKPAMKRVAGSLKLDLAAYRELQAFAQLGTDLDRFTQRAIDRGSRMMEILKQDQAAPMPIGEQIAVLKGANAGMVDRIPLQHIRAFEEDFCQTFRDEFPELLAALSQDRKLTMDEERAFSEAADRFRARFCANRGLKG